MKNVIILILLILSTKISLSQEDYNPLEIRGNFETNLQSYFVDSSIGANEPTPERVLNNAYLNLLITKGKFTSGLRYESYLNALKDYDPQYRGNGIPFRFISYVSDGLEVQLVITMNNLEAD